jgi:Zn-dependent metalloprotease
MIPPHMLDHVANHGDDAMRISIAATLQHSTMIAQQRHAAADGLDRDNLPGRKKLVVCNANHTRRLPGRRVLSSAEPGGSRDRTAREAFEGSGLVWDFFRRVFDRESIDGRGMAIRSTVHYGKDFDNAMWDGRQMIYGDGDGVFFNRFTVALDVMCHEMCHGVTQSESKLDYRGEPGALNEHVSDVFGIMCKQYNLNQRAEESDWILGAGLFTDRVNGQGIRSMKAPGSAYDDPVLGRDPQPAHMRHYVVTDEDNGGVHVNSGIPNHAFYRASVAVGGNSWSVTGRIWYATLTEKLTPRSNFIDMARATTAMAGTLHGPGSKVELAVAKAWNDVGLPVHVAQHPRLAIRRQTASATPVPKWRNRPAAAFNKERNV